MYARKWGYLKENTNQKQGQHDDDEEEEDELENEDDGGEDMVVEKQEQMEDNKWNRGNGWGVDSSIIFLIWFQPYFSKFYMIIFNLISTTFYSLKWWIWRYEYFIS